jgi:hypothetical protein
MSEDVSGSDEPHASVHTRDICRYTGVSHDPLMVSSHSRRFHGRSRRTSCVAVV